MPNEVKTIFTGDPKPLFTALDTIEKRLAGSNTSFNNLGASVNFGKSINDNFTLAGKGADAFKTKSEDAFKPTISRWTNEGEKAITTVNSLTTSVDRLDVSNKKLVNVGAESLKRIGENYSETAKAISKGVPDNGLYNDIEKARLSAQKLNNQRFDPKNFDGLSQSGLRIHNELFKVSKDVSRINSQLSKTTDKNLISELNKDLSVAEDKLARLNGRLNQYTNVAGGGAATGNRNLKLSSFQKTNLSYQVNDVLTGLASGQNPLQIAAQQGGQIAQIFSPAQIKAFTATYGGLVSILGAGTIAIAATYKITKSIREEAERLLKVEELITGAKNKQILAQKEALTNQAKFLAEQGEDRAFNRKLPTQSLDELEKRRDLLVQINQSLNATTPEIDPTTKKLVFKDNPKFQRNTQQINALNTQIEQTGLNEQSAADIAFNQRNEDFKKSQEESRKTREEDFRKSIENARKLKGLANDFRNDLVSLKSADNPLVRQMADLETVTERAQSKFGAFGDSVVKKIADIERANLTKAIGLQKFENNFEALNLRQQAQKLAETPEREFAPFQRSLELVERKVDFVSKTTGLNKQIAEADYYANEYNPNNPKSFEDSRTSFAEKSRFGENGLKLKDAISDINSLNGISLEGTGIYGKGAIADKILSAIPSRDELLKALKSPFADVRGNADFLLRTQSSALYDKRAFEQQKFNDFLENQKALEFGKKFAKEQIGLINNSNNLTDDDKARRRLAVTESLGNDLDGGLKAQKFQDYIRVARDTDKRNDDSLKALQDLKKAVEAIAKQLSEKGIKLDGKSLPASNVNVTVKSTDNNVQAELQQSPTGADTAAAYQDVYDNPDYRIGDAHQAGRLYGAKLIR